MCRILALTANRPFRPEPWLRSFAQRCRESHEYQGDGWGLAWWNGTKWERRRALDPIWSETFDAVPRSSAYLVHARSAFTGSPLALDLTMPFLGGGCAFAFNGELRGVRLSVPGANGAQRLFTLFQRFRDAGGDSPSALTRLDLVVSKRTDYVRALNVVIADGAGIHLTSRFNQEPDYFTMHATEQARGQAGEPISVVCSEPLAVPGAVVPWRPVPSGVRLTLPVPGHGRSHCGSPGALPLPPTRTESSCSS